MYHLQNMTNKQEFHITVESNGLTAVDLIANESELSRQKIKQAMQKGCVWLENQKTNHIQRLRRAKKILSKDEVVHFYYNPIILNKDPPTAALVSDEGGYSIWNKPAGMLSQGSKWSDHCTINRWAEKHLKPERPAFIVHRLDRAASGLIILAHTKQMAAQFSQLFQQRDIEKHYHVTVKGDFSKCLPAESKLKTLSAEIDGKKAISHVRVLKYNSETKESQLEVQIETGRKHQIRIHLSELSFPVVGDRLYGSVNIEKDLQLKAVSLKFISPIDGSLKSYSL
jgi:tRNA pseudouridine32 synthase/23S rRNA pseudouridine746 synthase